MTSNWTKTPNEILEAIPDMKEAELKLTMVIVRHTYGYHCESARMTYDDMEELTGMSRPAIGRAIDAIEKRGFFVRGRRSAWYINSNKLLLNEVNYSNNSELNTKEDSNNSELKDGENSNNLLPPSIYKEKDIKEKYIYTGSATDDQISPLIEALKTVTKEKYTNGRHGKFDDVALAIYHEGATPETIAGFGKWWEVNCWYDTPSRAALMTICDHWLDYMSGKSLKQKTSPNGHSNGRVMEPAPASERRGGAY